MRRHAIIGSVGLRAVIYTFCIAITYSAVQAKVKILTIPSPGEELVLRHYQITEVKDLRADQDNIGYLTTGAHNYFLSAQLAQPLSVSLDSFIKQYVRQNRQSEALKLYIVEYFLFENLSLKGAEIALKTHYALYNRAGYKLLDYLATETRNTGMNMGANAAELMSRSLVKAFKAMDIEIPIVLQNVRQNIPPALSCHLVQEGERNGLLAYNPHRRLGTRDFAGRPAPGKGASQATCGLQISYQIAVHQGKVNAILWLFPYFDPARSWLNKRKNIRQQLAYEQTYFSLSVFVARELMAEMAHKKVAVSELGETVITLEQKYNKRLQQLQTQFRNDTQYGANQLRLQQWKHYLAAPPGTGRL